MLAVCSTVRENGQDMPLDERRLARVRQTTEELNEQGLRVVAVAMKETAAAGRATAQVGYVAFLDPPKESAAQALQALVEEMLAVCSTVRENGQDMPLDERRLARVRQTTEELNEQGLRVVAVAMKETAASQTAYSQADAAGAGRPPIRRRTSAGTLVGYVAFLDPPKESAAQALQALAAHGVEVKVFTGDNELVTARWDWMPTPS